jgi:cation transport regulator
MPYQSVADLPRAQTDQYTPRQKEAFLRAFNSAYKPYGGDQGRAFAIAHAAAARAGPAGRGRGPRAHARDVIYTPDKRPSPDENGRRATGYSPGRARH